MIGNLDWTSFDSTEVGTMYYADNNLWNALVSILLGFAFFLLVASVTIGTNLLYDWHTSKESGPMKTKPFCQDYHDYLKEYENLKNVPEARMYFLEDKCQMSNLSTKKLSFLMAIIFKNDNPEVPKHARVISIKMAGFKYGNECHDFEPINGRAPGSEYCYKTFGNNRIQGTFYKENDVYYLAGFCIYVKNEFVMGFNFREDDVRWLLGGTPYPARTRGIRNTKSEMELAKRIMELKIEENPKNEEKAIPSSEPTLTNTSATWMWYSEFKSSNRYSGATLISSRHFLTISNNILTGKMPNGQPTKNQNTPVVTEVTKHWTDRGGPLISVKNGKWSVIGYDATGATLGNSLKWFYRVLWLKNGICEVSGVCDRMMTSAPTTTTSTTELTNTVTSSGSSENLKTTTLPTNLEPEYDYDEYEDYPTNSEYLELDYKFLMDTVAGCSFRNIKIFVFLIIFFVI
ncbi:hypothetical protein L5515_002217 [Caenorhabditis briggsae]|uniref:Uncharacterized protein n=1 Tax=Caenorhabditis briggsae TaxID=6238 RepID=A0AAE9E555_CAEBR|nr:hypothetical protein L5515_002217 [Caenorhabditis briggsae]